MAIHPILMSAPMVRAILREIDVPGTGKTQTRRILKPQPSSDHALTLDAMADGVAIFRNVAHGLRQDVCIRFAVGDLLWVRESWADLTESHGQRYQVFNWETQLYERRRKPFFWYRADGDQPAIGGEDRGAERWRPSIHMPKSASRLTSRVTDVRVQRLQDISEADARAEGAYVHKASGRVADDYGALCRGHWFMSARAWYADLWDRINGPGAWDRNDWVIATTFTPIAQNVSEVAA